MGEREVNVGQESVSGPDSQAVKRWLDHLARANRLWIRGTVIAGVIAGLFTIAQMALLASIINQGIIEKAPLKELGPLFLALLAVIVLRAAGQGFQTATAAQCSRKVQKQARQALDDHWRGAGPVGLAQSSAGELAREWIDHVEALHGYFSRFLPQVSVAMILPVLILALVFWLDWLAGIFLLLSAPLIPLFMALVGMGAEKLNQKHFEAISRLSGQFLDKVRGLTTLKLFGQTASAAELIRARSNQYRRLTMKTLRIAFLSSAVLEFFASVAIAVIAIYIGFGLLGYIDYGPAGELTLFSGLLILLLAPEFFQPLRTLSHYYHDRAAALGAGSEILERLNSFADQREPIAHKPVPGTDTTIGFESVSKQFRADYPVIRNLSLTFDKGDAIALTGSSGSGKSTLLHLLAGFIQPDSGSISVFGKVPGSFDFGWLGQSGFLMQGTWADNLRLTVPDASDNAIEQALRRVGLGDLLDSRGQGIDSQVSEGGMGLSGGQARRLTLARIFLADYDLILLDEPTAGLDRASEAVVIVALRELASAGKTLIFSTHNPTLHQLADRILLVCDGQVQDV